MPTEIVTKRCSKCHQDKDITEFTKLRSTKDGLEYHCISCNKKYRQEIKKVVDLYEQGGARPMAYDLVSEMALAKARMGREKPKKHIDYDEQARLYMTG